MVDDGQDEAGWVAADGDAEEDNLKSIHQKMIAAYSEKARPF